jgi:hypothetical protein
MTTTSSPRRLPGWIVLAVVAAIVALVTWIILAGAGR